MLNAVGCCRSVIASKQAVYCGNITLLPGGKFATQTDPHESYSNIDFYSNYPRDVLVQLFGIEFINASYRRNKRFDYANSKRRRHLSPAENNDGRFCCRVSAIG